MILNLSDRYAKAFFPAEEYTALIPAAKKAYQTLKNKDGEGNDFLGWVDLPVAYDKEEFARILTAAKKIRSHSKVLVVIGIGGSYLGARAAIEFVKSPIYNDLCIDTPKIYYAGNNISTTALTEILSICKNTDFSVNVISKSGTTTEPAVAFRVFKSLLIEKYGEEGAKDRIFVTTDRARGTLKAFSDAAGYETFVVPDDVGGRYSVLTAVGLLPIACAGIDIASMIEGAAKAREDYRFDTPDKNTAMQYAILRHLMMKQGKTVEISVGYEPYMLMFNEWWKQLFGESEGKDNKGLLPDSVVFSTDLHSLGQYIQEGQRMIFETVVSVKNPGTEFVIPEDSANVDGLNFLSGKSLDSVNKTAMLATLIAHNDGGVPNILIELADRSAYTFGYAVYFYELSCAISGYMLGVNPFNQPGVEAYKKNMFALLGKPGYEALADELGKRVKSL